jgi:ABC-type nitrate/sulfonate/bicarbonate transport system substrate-binding protein
MKRIALLVLVLILLAAPLLSGCAPKPAADLPVIRFVNFKVYDPTYIGIDQGFYEKHGVKVEIIGDVLAGPNAIQAVSGGSAELALSSIAALVLANGQGLPVQGVADVQTTFENQHLQRWYVLNDSPLQTLEDVTTADKPPVFCVNIWRSSFHTTALMAFDQRGIPEDAVEWRLLSFADQIPALIAGQCDIIGLMEPYQSYLQQQYDGQVRVLLDDYNDIYGQAMVSLIFANRVWARDNPDLVKAYVAGTVDAINWIEAHESEARAIIAKYTGIPNTAIPDYHFTKNGCIDAASVSMWRDYLLQRGDLTADWVTPEDVGTNIYNAACTP